MKIFSVVQIIELYTLPNKILSCISTAIYALLLLPANVGLLAGFTPLSRLFLVAPSFGRRGPLVLITGEVSRGPRRRTTWNPLSKAISIAQRTFRALIAGQTPLSPFRIQFARLSLLGFCRSWVKSCAERSGTSVRFGPGMVSSIRSRLRICGRKPR